MVKTMASQDLSLRIIVGLLSLFLVGQVFSISRLNKRPLSEQRLSVAPPKNIQYYTFGYSEVMADLFWLRAIQDFDFCDQPLGKAKEGYTICSSQSWLYKLLDAIMSLSPEFKMPYSTGPLALSVLISDKEGATKLFLRSVAAFPQDWKIHYRAAYHAILEEDNPKKAAVFLKIAADNGAPQWLYALAGRMFVEGGAEALGLSLAKTLEESGDENSKILAERINKKIQENRRKKSEATELPK